MLTPLAISWLAACGLALTDGTRRVAVWASVAALGATFVALAVLAGVVFADGPRETVLGDWPAGVGIVLVADPLGLVFALLSVGVLLAALVHEAIAGVGSRVFPALVLFLAAALIGLFLTADVFNFYVFFELSLVAAYILSAYGGAARQVRAGFIFAVVNLIGSFVFLLGVAAVYRVTGTLEMSVVAERIAGAEPNTAMLIAVALFVAFGIKLGLFPFHYWLPPVYASASPAVAAMLSGAVANIGSYGLLRFGAGVFPSELRQGATVLLVIGTASIVYGAVQALARRSTGEVLAYSAIAQAGYVLIALGIGGAVGFAAAVVYAVANSLNKTLLFLANGIRGSLVAAAFAVGAFSVAGVPPTAGFFGKLELFRAGVADESVALVALVVIGGGLSFVYMFQAFQRDFWRERDDGRDTSPPSLRAVTIVLGAMVLALGLWPEPLLAAGREAAEVLAVEGR